MSAGEILDTGFRLLRNHFVELVGISAIVNIPLGIAQSFVESAAPTGADGPNAMLIGVGAITLLGILVLLPIVQTAITAMLGDVYLGRETSMGGAFRKSLAIIFPLLGTSLLAGLIAIPAFLALLIPGFWFVLGLTALSPVMILERRFGMSGIRRSLELVKDNRMRALGISLVVAILNGVLGAAFGLIGGISPWLGGLAVGIAGSLTSAFAAAVFVVFYFEIRCRKEAFEIEHLARLVQEGAATRPTPRA